MRCHRREPGLELGSGVEVHPRVEGRDHEREETIHPKRRDIPLMPLDAVSHPARLLRGALTSARQHRLHAIDPDHVDAGVGDPERDPSGSAPQLEHRAAGLPRSFGVPADVVASPTIRLVVVDRVLVVSARSEFVFTGGRVQRAVVGGPLVLQGGFVRVAAHGSSLSTSGTSERISPNSTDSTRHPSSVSRIT